LQFRFQRADGFAGSASLGEYDPREKHYSRQGHLPQVQGWSAGQAEREALPCLPAPAAAIRETLTGHETESVTAHHILCRLRRIERQRADEM